MTMEEIITPVPEDDEIDEFSPEAIYGPIDETVNETKIAE